MRSSRNVVIAVAVMLLTGIACSAVAANLPEPKTLFTVMEMSWKEKNISIDIRYPQFNKPALDKLIKAKAVSGLDTFLKDAREYQADDAQNNGGSPREYVFYVDFDVRMLNSSVLSLTFDVFVDYSGAHPTTDMISLAVDIRTGKPITLDNLFKPKSNYLSVVSKQAIADLMAKLESPDKDSVNTGAGPTADNYSVFYFQPDQIVFHFNPYQVASFAEGAQEVSLDLWEEPYSTIVKPEIINSLGSAYK